MAEATPLFMDISSVYSGDELGLPYRDIMGEGVVDALSGNLLVTQTGTPGLSVNIAPGAAWIKGDTDTANQPTYRVRNDATVNLGITPDPTNPRIVLVVAKINDQTLTGSGRNWQLSAIHGTPAGSPVAPALPASAIPLASILVAANDTSITTGEITDLRSPAIAGNGQAYPIWLPYTPVWASSGTQPVLGNGTITGRYALLGKILHFRVQLIMGSTTTYGTGGWTISTPVSTVTSANGRSFAWDSSAGALYFTNTRWASASTVNIYSGAQPAALFTSAVPFTWATGDILEVDMTLEAA